jgi:hypothetical protein
MKQSKLEKFFKKKDVDSFEFLKSQINNNNNIDIKMVKNKINELGHLINNSNEEGLTLLHLILKEEIINGTLLQLMLENKNLDTNVNNNNQFKTPLHFYTERDIIDSKILFSVIGNGFDINIVDKNNNTILHNIIINNNLDPKSLILFIRNPNLNPNIRGGDNKRTILHLLVMKDDVNKEVLFELLKLNASDILINSYDAYSFTPLYIATTKDILDYNVIGSLMSHPYIKPNKQDNQLNTIIHKAIINEDHFLVTFLLLFGNILLNIENIDGHTPIDLSKNSTIKIKEVIKDYDNSDKIKRPFTDCNNDNEKGRCSIMNNLCDNIDCNNKSKFSCGNCHDKIYCSQSCANQDWIYHKKYCI